MNLKKLSLLSLAAAAMMIIGQSEANAQTNGYQFGIGYGFANGLNYGFNQSIQDDIPHFALYPPVYYSGDIVRRPYGVSPYAAPPGIMPVEMTMPVEPAIITNPYFREERIVPEIEIEIEEKPIEKKKDGKKGGKKGVETSAESNPADDATQHLNVVIRNPYFIPKSDVSSLAKVAD